MGFETCQLVNSNLVVKYSNIAFAIEYKVEPRGISISQN
jgi:hypothetical protein